MATKASTAVIVSHDKNINSKPWYQHGQKEQQQQHWKQHEWGTSMQKSTYNEARWNMFFQKSLRRQQWTNGWRQVATKLLARRRRTRTTTVRKTTTVAKNEKWRKCAVSNTPYGTFLAKGDRERQSYNEIWTLADEHRLPQSNSSNVLFCR